MAVLGSILPVVSQSSALALELYRIAASSHIGTATELIRTAKLINGFASTLKQVGTIVKEDDRLPSHEAFETLEAVIDQSRSVFSQVGSLASVQNDVHYEQRRYGGDAMQGEQLQSGSIGLNRLEYLQAHLEALGTTLSVLLQTLYTAQSIMWSKIQPTVLPRQAAIAVASERTQLETIVIDQQLCLLTAAKIHDQDTQANARLLMETDSSQSLIATGRRDAPTPANLRRFQVSQIRDLDTSASTESIWLPAVYSIAAAQSENLLERWTSLPQFDDRIRNAERDAQTHKRESQQPMVESDSEDDDKQGQKLAGNGTRMSNASQRSGSVPPLLTEASTLPVPSRESTYGPKAPLSPAASPRTSRDSLGATVDTQESPALDRSSMTSLPVEAAAAVEAKEEDDDVDLEIPWTLCTRRYYWRYIDQRLVESNTEQLPSIAFLERSSWTEIMASWVCKEAIREAGYRFTQVQKDVQDRRRTKLETCFCIEQPLQFQQVKQLVERTVEMYRERKPATPPPRRVRRSSFNRPPPPPIGIARASEIDRDRTPVPNKPSQPPMGRSTTSKAYTGPIPPPMDRSLSMPGPRQPGFHAGLNTKTPNLQIPGPYPHAIPQAPCQPHLPQGPYTPHSYTSPQSTYPTNPPYNNHLPPPQLNSQPTQSPLRQSYLHPHTRTRYDDDYGTTDSDSTDRDRRRQRSKSRSQHAADKERKRKSHTKSKAMGALMGVGGLTALLDGLGGL